MEKMANKFENVDEFDVVLCSWVEKVNSLSSERGYSICSSAISPYLEKGANKRVCELICAFKTMQNLVESCNVEEFNRWCYENTTIEIKGKSVRFQDIIKEGEF